MDMCYSMLLCCWFVVSLVRCAVGVVGCRVMALVELFVCVPCLSEDRDFKPVEGSYLVRSFWSWVRPIMAVMPSVTHPLVFKLTL
jgi:hypothetical protein